MGLEIECKLEGDTVTFKEINTTDIDTLNSVIDYLSKEVVRLKNKELNLWSQLKIALNHSVSGQHSDALRVLQIMKFMYNGKIV